MIVTWNFPATVLSATLALGITQFTTPPAEAVTTFNFSTVGSGLPEANLKVDGISLKVSNIVSNTNLTATDSDGLCFAGSLDFGFCLGTSSLQLLFDKPVRLLSYLTGFNTSVDATIIFTQGSSSSVQTFFPEQAEETFNNQFFAAAGIPIDVNGTSDGSIQLRLLTVEEVPGPLPVMGAAAAFGYSRKLRRRMTLSRNQA
jgi:hypothetical protein